MPKKMSTAQTLEAILEILRADPDAVNPPNGLLRGCAYLCPFEPTAEDIGAAADIPIPESAHFASRCVVGEFLATRLEWGDSTLEGLEGMAAGNLPILDDVTPGARALLARVQDLADYDPSDPKAFERAPKQWGQVAEELDLLGGRLSLWGSTEASRGWLDAIIAAEAAGQ